MSMSSRNILAAALLLSFWARQPLFGPSSLQQHRGDGAGFLPWRGLRAKVTTRNVERDVTNTTTTNESGNYTRRYLIVGRYQVRVEAPDSRPSSRRMSRFR